MEFITRFLKLEAAAGIILVFAAAIAMIAANSPLSPVYDGLLQTRVAPAPWLDKSVVHWINDGLMVLFFLLIGLELKRETIEGVLSDFRQIILPGIAAIGGLAIPALVFVSMNWGDDLAMQGWAIPTATDIAFTLGVMALLGTRVPLGVKVFVTTLAIIDDLAAIVIIAVFYTHDLSVPMLLGAFAALGGLVVLNRLRITNLIPYVLLGLVLWVLVLKSGVHATLAGVALALTIPMYDHKDRTVSPLQRLEHRLHPWVAYLILPLFAFANAGVFVLDMAPGDLLQPLPLGIALGLFLGKQAGIFGITLLALRFGWAPMPEGGTKTILYAASVLCGIGFTMSLFIGGLSFDSGDTVAMTRLGIIIGSLASAVLGYVLLAAGTRRPAA
ncbi:Na+/H+ antiporter NhaA [Emcibacter sp. SYSU 3D8]|uniref:Na+/H+ antiporter NhaA n=1 Tax=Emcibacter sp. SYSU 3D8 TaxID=3133969 RepID=UPI0031FEE2E8